MAKSVVVSDSNDGKGPVAIGMAVIAAIGLAFKAGCAKVSGVGDDAVRAMGSAASHGGSGVIDDAARTGAMASHLEEGVGDAAKAAGKEAAQNFGPDVAEAAYDAYKDRQSNAAPAPTPTPLQRPNDSMPFSQNPPARQLR